MIEFIKMYPFSVNYPLKNKLNKNVKNFVNNLLISFLKWYTSTLNVTFGDLKRLFLKTS